MEPSPKLILPSGFHQETEQPERFHRPEFFKTVLKKTVGQDDMKRRLASAFSEYTLFLDEPEVGRPVVMVYGPSGTGKTYSVETLCRSVGLPFTIVSSASLSPASYRGLTMRDLFIQHWQNYQTDEGIIFLDEIDKWCKGSVQGSDMDGEHVSTGQRMQSEVLRYLESEFLTFTDEAKDIEDLEHVQFRTGNLMWIMAGAFVGLDKLVKRRLHNYHLTNDEIWSLATPRDFQEYGLMAELAGRVQTWAWMKPLTDLQVMEILRDQHLPLWKMKFDAIDCELTVEAGALGRCAEAGREQGTGARGASAMLRRSLEDIYVHCSEHNVSKVTVDARTVLTGRIELEVA